MIIEIHNYLSASHQLFTQPGMWDSIVILDSNLPVAPIIEENSNKTLVLHFDDISVEQDRKIAPSSDVINQAIEFGVGSEKLMVCCRAGQSRSAAIAFSILFERLGEDAAIKLLNPKRHAPNERVIEIASGLVQRHGLRNAYEQWRSQSRKFHFTDFLDEIEQEYRELETLGAVDEISKS